MFSLSEVPTRMFSHLQTRVAYTEKRGYTRKIKIKARGNQATRKVSHFASRGRQTTLQGGPHPQAAINRSAVQVCRSPGLQRLVITVLLKGVSWTITVASVLLRLMVRILTGKCQQCIEKEPKTWESKKLDSSTF